MAEPVDHYTSEVVMDDRSSIGQVVHIGEAELNPVEVSPPIMDVISAEVDEPESQLEVQSMNQGHSAMEMDVAGHEIEISAEEAAEAISSRLDSVTAGEVELISDNLVFVGGDVLIDDGANGLLAQHYIETAGQFDESHPHHQIIAYIEERLPDNQNVPVIEQIVTNEDQERNDEPGDQEAHEIQNEMDNIEVGAEEEQHQQEEDVSPSSDSVEPFESRQLADQELQVVPDSSAAAVPDRSRFLNENLHEAMEPLVERQSPATSALGVQMVPTSSNDRIVNVHDGLPSEIGVEQQQQVAPVDELVQDVVICERERQTVPICDDASTTAAVASSSSSNDHLHQPMTEVTPEALYAFQGNVEQTYEVCVTLPATADENNTGGGQMQEIPIDISDWTNLGGQSLVAVAEDGTRIPLTVVRQGPDGEITYDANLSGANSNEVQHILQQLNANSIPVMQQSDVGASVVLNVEQTILPDNSAAGVVNDEQQQLQPTTTNLIHIPEDTSYISGETIKVQLVKVNDNMAQTPIDIKPAETLTNSTKVTTAATTTRKPRRSKTVDNHVPSVSQEMTSAGRENVEMLVELSNTTPSAISPENMQALIQILQSLPATARGQTIQIILQTDPLPKTADAIIIEPSPNAATAFLSAGPIVQAVDGEVLRVVQKVLPKRLPRAKKKTSDIAIQVTPEFIESAQSEILVTTIDQPQCPDASRLQTDVGTEVATVQPSEEVTSKKDVHADAGAMSEDERSRQIMAAIMESSRKRRAYRKKNSKQIVTVEEQWVTDPKPGVSYYAVVDYLSELDQDGGMSSASEMKRPEALSSGFMEDHLELQSVTGVGDEQPKNRSVLESTVDSSVIMSPFRRPTSTKLKQPIISTNETIDLPASLDESVVTLEEKDFEQIELADADDVEEPLDGGGKPASSSSSKKQKTKRLTKKSPRKTVSRSTKVRYDHKCGYCGFDSQDKILVVEHCLATHPDMPVKTLSLMSQTIGRSCPYCHQHFDHTEFFAHMRFAHSEVHPYKCGYCDFMGRDRNQIRHHVQKKHRLPVKIINLLDPSRSSNQGDEGAAGTGVTGSNNTNHHRRNAVSSGAISEGEESVYEYRTDEEEMDELGEEDATAGDARRGLSCPECKKTFKTLKYLKTHIKIHQAHRYQCGYCDFISIMLHQVLRHCQKKHNDVVPKVLTKELEPEKNPVVSRDMDDVIKKVFSLNTRLPRDPDQTKWMRKWFCPHCDYTCQFGASYRRHLRMHANILPYKCNYCSFKGREKYYVRRHISRMHPELPGIVVENNPENCARDTSSDEDFQEKGLRRKRRRRTKEALHAVVPLVEDMDPDSLQEQYQLQPIREKKLGSGRWTSDAESEVDVPAKPQRSTRASGILLRPITAPAESDTNNKASKDKQEEEEKIVCKACNQKVSARIFQQHASQHFKKIVPFKCAYCNYMSVNKSDIRLHSNRKHVNLPLKTEECHLASLAPRDFVALIGGDAIDVKDETPKFTCPLCQSLVDYDETVLSGHFYAHFEYYPFRCSECEHQNVSEEKVREHAIVHGGPFVVYETDQEKPEGLEDTIKQFLQEGQELVQRKLIELMDVDSSSRLVPDTSLHNDADEGEATHVHVFLCPVCDLQMDMKAAMIRRHLYDHYSYKPFKCGHCRYVGLSRTGVRSHSANKHRDVTPVIEMVHKLMPEDLAKMLREIDKQLKVIQGQQDTRVNRDPSSGPVSVEGSAWMEKLSRNVCPWCDVDSPALVGGDKLRVHLLSHFGSKRLFNCMHCGESFSRKREAAQHVLQRHPGFQFGFNEELDEDTVRRGLRLFLESRKSAENHESVDKVQKCSRVPEVSDKVQDQEEPKTEYSNEIDAIKKSIEEPPPYPRKGDDDDEDSDNNDIVTVEGVLLTRTFRSETEASDDDDYEYGSDSDDDSDFLIGDLDPDLVEDIVEVLSKHSFGSKVGEQLELAAEEEEAEEEGPVFVCGYCDFSSEDQDVTKAHTDENHSKAPGASSKDVNPRELPKRRVRCRGGAFKRSAIKTMGSGESLNAKRPRTVHDEDETLENIVRMVQNDSNITEELAEKPSKYSVENKNSCESNAEVEHDEEEETLENIIKMVQNDVEDQLPDDEDPSKDVKQSSAECDNVVVEIGQLQPEEETLENIIRMVQYHEGNVSEGSKDAEERTE